MPTVTIVIRRYVLRFGYKVAETVQVRLLRDPLLRRRRYSQDVEAANPRSVNFPQTRGSELQEMPVRISKINAVTAARPFGTAVDGDFMPEQSSFPRRQLFGRYRECDVQCAAAIVRRNCAAWHASGFE